MGQPCRPIEPVVRGDSGYRESEEQVPLGPRATVVVGTGCLKSWGKPHWGLFVRLVEAIVDLSSDCGGVPWASHSRTRTLAGVSVSHGVYPGQAMLGLP